MKKFEKLKTEYPAYISLDQLHVICKITKRTASYLVTNGIILAIDTGRKTWRYRISIDDVIDYLRKRDRQGSMIPVGAANSRKTNRRKASYSQKVAPGDEYLVAEYFEHVYADYPDILTTSEPFNLRLHSCVILFCEVIAYAENTCRGRRPAYPRTRLRFT